MWLRSTVISHVARKRAHRRRRRTLHRGRSDLDLDVLPGGSVPGGHDADLAPVGRLDHDRLPGHGAGGQDDLHQLRLGGAHDGPLHHGRGPRRAVGLVGLHHGGRPAPVPAHVLLPALVRGQAGQPRDARAAHDDGDDEAAPAGGRDRARHRPGLVRVLLRVEDLHALLAPAPVLLPHRQGPGPPAGDGLALREPPRLGAARAARDLGGPPLEAHHPLLPGRVHARLLEGEELVPVDVRAGRLPAVLGRLEVGPVLDADDPAPADLLEVGLRVQAFGRGRGRGPRDDQADAMQQQHAAQHAHPPAAAPGAFSRLAGMGA
eukprot:CAMPEP_0179318130 /NCGR_PEP_ID=MMETSP0797-20121207/56695_1 /TAXON_ID=47934 /ORGANISM="Dinophysis acuminata, Strain DAEP01" /LENGTH=318 /DNA_ID=CAMNT_0021029229 /DNA_START=49 /DNA_END=1002 /DNA_ORIENTATION=-